MNIRNFAIIAHVDHGKSTLCDRLMEICGLIKPGHHENQMLDRNPISRERGITIKLAPVKLRYQLDELYTLNLIDTPGHVDFSYEVERTLACVEGVVLLVDATQGIQAQTIAHYLTAQSQNLTVIPVVNKIDRINAQTEKVCRDLANLLNISVTEIITISAKTGFNCQKLLEQIIQKIPPPQTRTNSPKSTQALIFDSYYDQHLGVIAFTRVFSGSIVTNDNLMLVGTKADFQAGEVGFFYPDLTRTSKLSAGDVGYVATGLKSIKQVHVGDTITGAHNHSSPLPGYRESKPMVYAFIFPTENQNYESLVTAVEKLALNDSSLAYKPIHSQALGAGLRIGFLGLLHAEIVRERLEQEHQQSLVITPPQIEYKEVHSQLEEPITKTTVITPEQYINAILAISYRFRAELLSTDNVNLENQVIMTFSIPLSELMGNNFFDTLKSISSGYATLDWEFWKFQPVDASSLSILLNGNEISEFSQVVVHDQAFHTAQKMVNRLQKLIPRQQFEVRIQARFQNKIIASARIAPFRKDVTAKLYGGDRTRKDKLLKKQKKGKGQLKQVGQVSIPKETFIKLFARED